MPRSSSARTARAERRAISSQMGWPEGASAECVSDMPSASPTTCDVAAVPRNWQPPPGVAQARQRSRAASSSVILPCAKRAPEDCTLPASSPSSGEQRDAAGHQHAGQIVHARQRHHHGRQSLVAGGDADDAAARGQRADQAAEDGRGIVAIGQGIEHAGGALRAAVAGVGAVGGEGDGAERLQFLGGGVHEQPDLPVAGVVAERDGRAIGGADAAVGAEDQEFLAAERCRSPSPCRHPAPGRRGRRRAAAAASRA